MSDLIIKKSQTSGRTPITVLHLHGQLDGSTENILLDEARQVHVDGAGHLLIDLSEITMLTSAGLRAIQNILKIYTPPGDIEIMHQHPGEPYKSPYFKIVCPNPQVYYVLNIAGFLQTILIYNDMDEAVNSFDG
jgi:anti-anti-sigma regulatory factor